ncbi:MAG: hypothetical protein JSV72_03250 [Ralstonia sp.]|jgi:hypothetical protein|nr:MAG: hypothetical protein JSV72_03250 [Ralstonia sp.]
MTTITELDTLHQWLRDRLPLAQQVPPLNETAKADWNPVPADCHANADRWIERSPGCKRIRGWVIEGGREYGAICHAHSVVQDASGQLWDVTLDSTHRFIPYLGLDSTYDDGLVNRGWAQIILLAW